MLVVEITALIVLSGLLNQNVPFKAAGISPVKVYLLFWVETLPDLIKKDLLFLKTDTDWVFNCPNESCVEKVKTSNADKNLFIIIGLLCFWC
jgi:hypothetical protein